LMVLRYRFHALQVRQSPGGELRTGMDCTPCVRPKNWEQVNQHIQQQYAGVKE